MTHMIGFEKPMFNPWVGPAYFEGARRILLLAESHYLDGSEPYRRGFTQWVVSDVQREKSVIWGRTRIYSRMFSAVNGTTASDATMEEWIEFWDRVSFYTYLQTTNLIRPLDPVDECLWEESKEAFIEVLQILKPTTLFVFGYNLFGKILNFPETVKSSEHMLMLNVPELDDLIETWRLMHPASPQFNFTHSQAVTLTGLL
jgi:hypothetical protein